MKVDCTVEANKQLCSDQEVIIFVLIVTLLLFSFFNLRLKVFHQFFCIEMVKNFLSILVAEIWRICTNL